LELKLINYFEIISNYFKEKTKRTKMTRRLSLLKQPLISTLNDHLIDYPTPSNLTYWWGFGSIAGICLVIQIITGVFLAMHYTPHVDLAFLSVEHITVSYTHLRAHETLR